MPLGKLFEKSTLQLVPEEIMRLVDVKAVSQHPLLVKRNIVVVGSDCTTSIPQTSQ